ncbi:peptidase M20 domain-containing protein 2-like [Nerophis lumbriciformis]|uniref:peptidase M20 domain-containing protein 2-like n=1 Tax=Nerophis lumbriciformis TaxID=546530 RepID=UPI003BAC28E1
MQVQQMKKWVQSCIDHHKDKLSSLSRDIWAHSEIGGQETYAVERFLRFFRSDPAWSVQSPYMIPTAFRASWGPVGGNEEDPVLNLAFLCEYNALPDIGHACGHNLIAEVGAAAAWGLKAALERQTELPPRVKVTILGTPSEEDHGGKIQLLDAGAFADIHLVFMAHPAVEDVAFSSSLTVTQIMVKYRGKASHVSAFPWMGVNALDAAVQAYSNLTMLRPQLKPGSTFQGIIKHGGVKANITPDYSELQYCLLAPTLKEVVELKAKVETCLRAAAMATSCELEISYPGYTYLNIVPNATLAKLYEDNGTALGIQFTKIPTKFAASTDFGNVSYVIPGIHPIFSIATDAFNHTEAFAEAAGSEDTQMYTLRVAKALAMTAVDVLCSPCLLRQVRDDFAQAVISNMIK